MSYAICEYFLLELNKKTETPLDNVTILFATHFTELDVLQHILPKNKVYHLSSELDQNKRLRHTFKLQEGTTQLKTYGIF